MYLTLPFFLKQAVLPVWDSKNSLKLLDKIQSSEETSLYEPKRPIDPKRNFLGKSNKIFLIYLLSSFIVYNMKKILRAVREEIQNLQNSPRPPQSEAVHRAPCRANKVSRI